MLKILAILLILLTWGASFAQTLPPFDEGPVGTGPYDPASWRITSTVEGHIYSKSWTINGEGHVVSYTVNTPSQDLIGGAENNSNTFQTFFAEVEGAAYYEVKYIGPGVIPNKVILKLTGHAGATAIGNGASVALENGIGSPVTMVMGSFFATGTKFREVTLDENGEGNFEISLFGRVSCTDFSGGLTVTVNPPVAQLGGRAVGVGPWLGVTYHYRKETLGNETIYVPVPNDLSDPTDYVVDTVAPWIVGFGYYTSPIFQPLLLGPWQSPMWQISPSQVDVTFASFQYGRMMLGFPAEYTINVNAQDFVFSESGKVKLRVHPEMEIGEIKRVEKAYGTKVKVSGDIILLPGGSHTETISHVVSATVTKEISTTASFQISSSFEDVVAAALGIDITEALGTTAELAIERESSTTCVNTFSTPALVRFYQQPFWRKTTAYAPMYNAAGFCGTGEITAITFWSGTKALAELADTEETYTCVPYN